MIENFESLSDIEIAQSVSDILLDLDESQIDYKVWLGDILITNGKVSSGSTVLDITICFFKFGLNPSYYDGPSFKLDTNILNKILFIESYLNRKFSKIYIYLGKDLSDMKVLYSTNDLLVLLKKLKDIYVIQLGFD